MDNESFHTDLFTEPEHYEEGPLRDRKAEIPDLRRPDKKAEFIRDVIALANTARMLGKPAYLLFGIDDNGNLCGVENSLRSYRQGGEPSHRTWERVKQQIGQAIQNYINPVLTFDVKHNIVGGKEVAYLLIQPVSSPAPFQVKNDLRQGGQVYLFKEQCWVRFGESKYEIQVKEISPTQAPYTYSYMQVPFLTPSNWQRYFEKVLADEIISRAQQIKVYQELITTTSVPLQGKVDEFLKNRLQMLIIEGIAGSGKSAFIQRLVGNWAESGLAAMREAIRREEFIAPPTWIPVYFPLRGRQSTNLQQLIEELTNYVNRIGHFWTTRPSEPERLLEDPSLRWLICLDGLDEIWKSEWQNNFLSVIDSFMARFLRIKIILTTRPAMTGLRREGWSAEVVEIAPLSSKQITGYIAAFISDEQYDEVINVLQSDDDLWQLCSIPAYIEAAMRELADIYLAPLEDAQPPPIQSSETADVLTIPPVTQEQVSLPEPAREEELIFSSPENDVQGEVQEKQEENVQEEAEGISSQIPIRKGVLLDKVYQFLWQRETHRRPLPIGYTDEWWEKTGYLAAKLDGHSTDFKRNQAIGDLSSEECFYWIAYLSVLKYKGRNKWCFYTDLTKVYFAASFLLTFVEERQEEEGHQWVSSFTLSFKDKLYPILSELTAADIDLLFQGG